MGAEHVESIKAHVATARDLSLAAVGEYHDLHEQLFEEAGLTKRVTAFSTRGNSYVRGG